MILKFYIFLAIDAQHVYSEPLRSSSLALHQPSTPRAVSHEDISR